MSKVSNEALKSVETMGPQKLEPQQQVSVTPPQPHARIISSISQQDVARQKAEELVNNIATEGLLSLERLRREVDGATMAMQEHQADLEKSIMQFYRFTADTIESVKVMENAMSNITNHFKSDQK